MKCRISAGLILVALLVPEMASHIYRIIIISNWSGCGPSDFSLKLSDQRLASEVTLLNSSGLPRKLKYIILGSLVDQSDF